MRSEIGGEMEPEMFEFEMSSLRTWVLFSSQLTPAHEQRGFDEFQVWRMEEFE